MAASDTYGVVHRLAGDGSEKGIGAFFLHGQKTQYQRGLWNLPCRKSCLCASPEKMWFYPNLQRPWKLSGERRLNHQSNLENYN